MHKKNKGGTKTKMIRWDNFFKEMNEFQQKMEKHFKDIEERY